MLVADLTLAQLAHFVLVLSAAGAVAGVLAMYALGAAARLVLRELFLTAPAVGGIGGNAPDVHLSPRNVPHAKGQGSQTAPGSPCH